MTAPADTETRSIHVEQLLFDVDNPRLRADVPTDSTQRDLFDILWRDFAVDEVAASIAANGYFPYEPLFVFPKDGHYVVIEGNRRLAALKGLLGHFPVPGHIQLPAITDSRRGELESVPARITDRAAIWQYIGFKHVNGPQAWQSASKAEYVAWVHGALGVPLRDISNRIGDRHSTVQRLYRALMVVEEAEESGVWNRGDRVRTHFSFSHLYTGLDYSGIGGFIQVSPASEESRRPVPDQSLPHLGELCTWLYGSKSLKREPVVRSQNPDLRRLDRILQNPDSVAALRKNLPLEVGEDIARGDPTILRESLVTARNSLQVARGRVLTGYDGETDLLRLVLDINDLSYQLHNDMESMQRQGARRIRRSAPDVGEE